MRQIGLDHGASDLAMPPIRPDEAKDATTALCPQHGSQLTHLNADGTVFWCPLGLMYWRASKRLNGFHSRLAWPKGL